MLSHNVIYNITYHTPNTLSSTCGMRNAVCTRIQAEKRGLRAIMDHRRHMLEDNANPPIL